MHVPNCMKNLGSENSTSFKDTSFRASSVEGRKGGRKRKEEGGKDEREERKKGGRGGRKMKEK